MTGPLVPPELLAALPDPWHLADQARRTQAIRELPPHAERRAVALSALEACLAYLVDAVPERLVEGDLQLNGSLVTWLPTLADVTHERVRDWADAYGHPSPDAVGRMWTLTIVTGATDDLIRWFRRKARESLTAPERARLVEMLKVATPRLPWYRTILTIPAILDLGGPEQRDYFDRLANDPGLHAKTRAEAAAKRWLIDGGTAPLVPAELVAAMPDPWGMARPTEDPPPDREQRAAALSALEACFAYMTGRGDEADGGLPDEFYECWFTVSLGLRQALPRLADITRERARAWIEADVDPVEVFGATWTTPPDDVVEAVCRDWAFFIVNRATGHLMRWFRGSARDHLDDAERARLIGLLKDRAPELPWRLATVAVQVIFAVGGPAEREYFDRLAGDPGVHEKTRAEAASKRWLIDRRTC